MLSLDRVLRNELFPEWTSRAGPGQKRQTGMTPRAIKRDQTIPLGIVGGGTAWESRFRAATLALTRGRVAAVYSPQPCEARVLAEETGGQLFLSLRRMIHHPGVKALLILESGWAREWGISLAAARQIPVFVASPIDENLPRMAGSLAQIEADGAVVVPGALLRATPAALRLRELVATKLGPIQELKIDMPSNGDVDSHLIGVIDWCRWLLGSTVSHMERQSTADEQLLVMNCGRPSPHSPPVRTEIRVVSTAAPQVVRVSCQLGDAELIGESLIHWRTELETTEESLAGDRPAEQVLLDLFLRRVVGGVVPVPSWADLQTACQLLSSVR